MSTYIQCIGKTEEDRWWEWISRPRMDTHYFQFNGSAWKKERREIDKKYKEESGGKPGTVRQLMSSRNTTLAELTFIAITRTGKKDQKHEQEMEKPERERDEA